jgi:hypothetical protein
MITGDQSRRTFTGDRRRQRSVAANSPRWDEGRIAPTHGNNKAENNPGGRPEIRKCDQNAEIVPVFCKMARKTLGRLYNKDYKNSVVEINFSR